MMLVLRTVLFTLLVSSVVESMTDNPCAGINCNSGTCRSDENGSPSCCCPEGCKGETCSDDDNSSCEAANGECVANDGTCAADLILDIPCCNGKVCCRAPSTAVACEGSTLTLSCDDGDYLVITAANYGRENYKTCPHTNILTDQCYSSASLSVVQKECGGKQTCSLEASSDNFGGDPCLRTYKYLKVSYYCAAATEIVVCEGSTLSLPCDDGGVLAITAANYGRDDYEICPHSSILTDRCFSSGSLSAVQTACEGKQSCSLAVNSATFGGDPCRGTYKYLKVSYYCAAATEIVVCEGSTLSLSCDDGVLAITAANYGRDDYEICPHPSILTDRCFSSGSLSAVQTACEGKQSCSLAVNSATFGGDPCSGTSKYLKVSYFCAALISK